MNRGDAEEQGNEISLSSTPVTFIERAPAAAEDEDEGFGEGVASGEDIKLLLSKAEQGDQGAQFDLGLEYYLKNNFEESFQWFQKAADQGHAEAQCHIAKMYEYGEAVEQDSSEAARWYRKAADQGLTQAQDRLEMIVRRQLELSKKLPQ
jgi:TPR repeat protein